MAVHPAASDGYAVAGSDYEQARPAYPAEAIDLLCTELDLGPASLVVELGAGTGKLTRLLAPTVGVLVATEPVEAMRAELASAVSTPVVAATAEALPFADGAVDAVTVAQAFHWFDADRAFAELGRVLRPGGRLGLVWNARDRAVDWVDKVWAIMDRVERRAPWRDHANWREAALGDRPSFGPLHAVTFRHEHPTTPEGVVDRMRAVSHVAALPPPEQARVLDEVRELLAVHPETKGREELRIPYRVDCFWTERR
ncbi:MAG TPA: class I SAM-dependent methyltransferase [Actinomycetes bacterium]|nr:class I SAM-dependent methyltransferase [Actinomycetes bacterium]